MDASKRSGRGNAYFTGLGKQKRIVFFDTLLEQLKPDEIVSVLAHEIRYSKKNHIIKGIALSLVMSFLAFYLTHVAINHPSFLSSHGFKSSFSCLKVNFSKSHILDLFFFSDANI